MTEAQNVAVRQWAVEQAIKSLPVAYIATEDMTRHTQGVVAAADQIAEYVTGQTVIRKDRD